MKGSSLYNQTCGSGEPLVLLHAGLTDLRMWDAQVGAFGARYFVVRFDAQGFGQSAAAPEPATRADDLHELLLTLGIRRAHLVGVSFGGSAAIDFAISYPNMVGALIPVASGLSGYQPSDPSIVEWIDDLEQRESSLLYNGDLDGATEIELQAWLAGPRRRVADMSPALVERVRPMARLALQRQAERARAPQIEPPAAHRLAEITAPTLVMIGDADVPVVIETADVVAARVPGAAKQVYTDTAHLIPMERPDEFNAAVLAFLDAHPLR